MPIIFRKEIAHSGLLGIWQVREEEDFFRKELKLTTREEAQLAELRGRRALEWLASRYLLHVLSERETRGEVLKDACGKPHLEGSAWHISLSHSHDLVAVIAAPAVCGIDIQYRVARIERIAQKFLRAEELDSLSSTYRVEHLHAYWGAKESLYKIYGRRELDFRQHILVAPFEYMPEGGMSAGVVQKDTTKLNCTIDYQRLGEVMLVWGMEVE
jgi:phosphopantetheinyl transferase